MKSTDPPAQRISSKSCDEREPPACTDHRDEQPVRKNGEGRKTGASHLGASPSALAPFPVRREPGEALGAGNTRSRREEAARPPGWHKRPTIVRSTLSGLRGRPGSRAG